MHALKVIDCSVQGKKGGRLGGCVCPEAGSPQRPFKRKLESELLLLTEIF